MKTYFLLGFAALGLITLAPIESKADDGLTLSRDTNKTDLTTMAMKDTVTSIRRTNIGCTNGTARIIGTTTIATTTRIDASVAVIGFFVTRR